MSWRSGHGVVYVYECGVCKTQWWTKARQSRCGRCGIVYYPKTDTRRHSKIVPRKKEETEQLHLR